MSQSYPLDLFDSEPINIDHLTGEAFLHNTAKLVLKYLWQNWGDEALPETIFDIKFFKQLMRKHHALPSLFRALVRERDPFFMKAARNEVQVAFNRLWTRLQQDPPQDPHQIFKVNLAIHNMLSIYVMFSPTPFENLTVPQLIDENWHFVEYVLDPIEISPSSGWWVNFLGDQDRLFSYGLRPAINAEAKSILMHCGTGWGTAQGIGIQILADLWPGKTPGEIFIEWQHEAISEWIDKQNGKITVAGQSLGGSLSYLTAMHKPDKVDKAYCLVPPGLERDFDRDHPLFGSWERTPKKQRPKVFIQKQKFDPVSKCGFFKGDFKLVKTHLTQNCKVHPALELFAAHACNYAACDDSVIEFADIHQENLSHRRAANNKYLYTKGRMIALYGFVLPFFLVIRPILGRWVSPNINLIGFTLLFAAALTVVTALFGASVPLVGSSFVGIWAASYVMGFVFNMLLSIFNLPKYVQELKMLSLSQAMLKLAFDICNIMTLGLLKSVIDISLWFYGLRYFFEGAHLNAASIHTEAYHLMTENLDNHPDPTIKEKLQVFGIVALFYIFALPIKFILHDVPKFVVSLFKQKPKEGNGADSDPFVDIEVQVINQSEPDLESSHEPPVDAIEVVEDDQTFKSRGLRV